MNNAFMINNRQDLLKNLIGKFTRAMHSMNKEHNFPFGDYMLGKQEIMILFFVFENKGIFSAKDIAKFLRVTPGAVTQFTDSLVEKKLVNREVNLSDRRGVNIKLTANAKKDFNNFKKKFIESLSKSFAGLSNEEIQQFINLVDKIKQ